MKNNDRDAILVNNLSKVYSLYDRPQDRLKQMFLRKRKKLYRDFWALKDISFDVKKGEALGIIGRNGAGKSTLLQILAGTLSPTDGEVSVNGRAACLLELGSGFNPEFTGRENVYLNGSILGFSRSEMDELFDEIVSFADIGEFMEQPVKLYSSGMYVRLAFAVQACVEPDVLIVDEALSVGDIFFQQKCHARMEELITEGTAIVIVSHSMEAIEKYSNKVMLLDGGCCRFLGQPNEAVERYYQVENSYGPSVGSATAFNDLEYGSKATLFETDIIPDWPPEMAFMNISRAVSVGDLHVAKCVGVAVCDDKGKPRVTFEIGDVACFYYEFEFFQDSAVPVGGVVLTNKMNVNVHGKNSLQYLVKAPPFIRKGTRVRFRQTIELQIAPGEYTFQVGLASISAEDYARVPEMNYGQLHGKLEAILRVRGMGVISVQMKSQGIRMPFYGYADLQGECALSTLTRD